MLMPPRIEVVGETSEEDKAAAYIVNAGLDALQRYVESFASALTMFEFSMAQRLKLNPPELFSAELREIVANSPGSWMYVAARDGAMSIYHFYIAFEGIRDTTATNKSLSGIVDRKSFRDVGRKFRQQFKSFVDMRDAVSHSAEKTKTPEKHKEHSLSGTFRSGVFDIRDSTGVTIDDCLSNRTYQTSWNGKLLNYDISPETLIALDSYRAMVWDIFQPTNEAKP